MFLFVNCLFEFQCWKEYVSLFSLSFQLLHSSGREKKFLWLIVFLIVSAGKNMFLYVHCLFGCQCGKEHVSVLLICLFLVLERTKTEATTFAFSSVFILLLWLKLYFYFPKTADYSSSSLMIKIQNKTLCMICKCRAI